MPLLEKKGLISPKNDDERIDMSWYIPPDMLSFYTAAPSELNTAT